MFVRVHVFMCVWCEYVFMSVCAYVVCVVRVYVCVWACMPVWEGVCDMCACMCLCVHVCVCAHMCMHLEDLKVKKGKSNLWTIYYGMPY